MWLPTPTAGDAKSSGSRTKTGKNAANPGISLTDYIIRGFRMNPSENVAPRGGTLHPRFVEWVMGLPLSWTDVNDTDENLSTIEQD